MLALPPELIQRYEARLVQQNLMAGQRPHYHKWLRYYLDFCQKYGFSPADRQSLPAFQEKLRTKHQPETLCEQAGHAIYTRPWCKRPLKRRCVGPEFRNEHPRIPSATASPVISCKPITTFALFRNCWATAMCARP